MAVTSHVYSKLSLSGFSKKVDLTADTIKVMLLSAYTVGTTQDTAQFVADVLAVATEAVGTGYTASGQALVTPTFTLAGHVYTYTTTTTPSWSASGGALAAAYALFYDSTPGSNSTNPVICYWDFGGTLTATNAAYSLPPNAGGIFTSTGV